MGEVNQSRIMAALKHFLGQLTEYI